MTLYSAQTGAETIGGDRARGPKHVPVLPTCRPIELCESPPHGAQIETWCCTTREKGDCRPGPHHVTTSMRFSGFVATTSAGWVEHKAEDGEQEREVAEVLVTYLTSLRQAGDTAACKLTTAIWLQIIGLGVAAAAGVVTMLCV